MAVRDKIVADSFGFGGGGHEESAGFGVRVIHSGVWGFASSPIVTEDEIKKVAGPGHRRGQGQRGGQEASRSRWRRSPAYTDYWAMPVKTEAEDGLARRQDRLPDADQRGCGLKVPGVMRVQSKMAFDFEWKYLATSEGSYIEQEIWRAGARLHGVRAQGRQVQVADLLGGAAGRRLRGDHRGHDARERRADLRRGDRALHRAAGRRSGSRTWS